MHKRECVSPAAPHIRLPRGSSPPQPPNVEVQPTCNEPQQVGEKKALTVQCVSASVSLTALGYKAVLRGEPQPTGRKEGRFARGCACHSPSPADAAANRRLCAHNITRRSVCVFVRFVLKKSQNTHWEYAVFMWHGGRE